MIKSANALASRPIQLRNESIERIARRASGRDVGCKAASESAPPAEAAAAVLAPKKSGRKTKKKELKIKGALSTRSLNWDRWEMVQHYRLEGMREVFDDEDGESTSGRTAFEGGGAEALAQQLFSHYDNPASHTPYLRDSALLAAYRSAIENNAEYIAGKVVVDIGCGPGLPFALMCAAIGAKRVYAIEGSPASAALAEKVVAANNFQDIIVVCQGAAENIVLQEKADVLVSNWMGPLLLSGGMLKTVLATKEKFLKGGGLILPDLAEIYVCGIEDRDYLMEGKEMWDEMAGFSMGGVMTQVVKQPRLDTIRRSSQIVTTTDCLVQLSLNGPRTVVKQPRLDTLRRSSQIVTTTDCLVQLSLNGPRTVVKQPRLDTLRRSSQIVTTTDCLVQLSLNGLSVEDVESLEGLPFELTARKDERIFALLVYFEASFAFNGRVEEPFDTFTTKPQVAPTHHKQLMLNFPKGIAVEKGDKIKGTMSIIPTPWDPRQLEKQRL
eukprot:gene14823-20876_t